MDRAAAEHSKVVLDASGFTFADSRLLNPLIPTHRTVDLRVAAPTRQLCRLLEITGVDALLTVRSTVEEAAACWAPRSAWPSSPYSGAGRCSPSARLSAPPFRPVASGYRPVGPGRWPGCRGEPEEGARTWACGSLRRLMPPPEAGSGTGLPRGTGPPSRGR
ncbi:STAS domain-containing protein [Streptomyces tendae]|uniref:STAS domain-containing protein n=1 Tax=Streptomyces tendae TaxID=1932 RepID=UPI0030B8D743